MEICEIRTGSKGSGYLSKELINKMMVKLKRDGHTLTDLYITQKDAEDIRSWADVDLSVEERKEVTNTWSINIHQIEDINTDFSGKSRIIGFDFKDNKMSEAQKLFHVKGHLSGNNSEIFSIGIIDRLNK